MIELHDDARQELEGFFADKEKSPVRIYLGGGCGGPRLALGLDSPGDDDDVFDLGGLTFCIEKPLLESIQGVKMFMSGAGFEVEPLRPLPVMGGSGGCCGGHGQSQGGGCGCGGGQGHGGGSCCSQ